jgi:protein-L-isoaspartate(D-aspartate) O-methyltransferase
MDFALARRKMVENQLRTNRVTDEALVHAFGTIPRERFVPASKMGYAYVDEDLEVARDRFLLEPMVLGRLIQALSIAAGDMVLDVACATGYSTAVLGSIAGTVVAVEEEAQLAQKANETLNALSVDNAVVVHHRHAEGYPKQAPYDAILIGGALPEVPQALFDQLADGGRLAAVIKTGAGLGRATLFSKRDALVGHRILFDAGTPELPGFARSPGFVF